jgi:hypothetical protein
MLPASKSADATVVATLRNPRFLLDAFIIFPFFIRRFSAAHSDFGATMPFFLRLIMKRRRVFLCATYIVFVEVPPSDKSDVVVSGM